MDERMNCEDIAMNFLISHISRKPPIKVRSLLSPLLSLRFPLLSFLSPLSSLLSPLSSLNSFLSPLSFLLSPLLSSFISISLYCVSCTSVQYIYANSLVPFCTPSSRLVRDGGYTVPASHVTGTRASPPPTPTTLREISA